MRLYYSHDAQVSRDTLRVHHILDRCCELNILSQDEVDEAKHFMAQHSTDQIPIQIGRKLDLAYLMLTNGSKLKDQMDRQCKST